MERKNGQETEHLHMPYSSAGTVALRCPQVARSERQHLWQPSRIWDFHYSFRFAMSWPLEHLNQMVTDPHPLILRFCTLWLDRRSTSGKNTVHLPIIRGGIITKERKQNTRKAG